MVEAVRTSILSTRWRNLHKYITRLDFSPTSKQLQTIREEGHYGHHRVRRLDFLPKYARVINRTLLTRNAGACLQEVRLYLPWIYSEGWAIHIKPFEGPMIRRWLDFTFSRPLRIIHIYVNSPHPLRSSLFLPRNENASSFKTLKELSLTTVDVDEELFGLLLSSFVALERLSIEHSPKLSIDVVLISGDVMAPKLKHLNMLCWVESVEVRDAVNLESLTCRPRRKLLLENVPRLVELDTCASTGIETLCRGNGVMISDQLVKLKLSDAYGSVKDTHVIC